MMKTVLVATDGSDHAKKACALASDIAARFGARLIVLHVLLSGIPAARLGELANRRKLTKAQRDLLDHYEADMQAALASSGAMAGYGPIAAPAELLEPVGRQILQRAEAQARKAGVTNVVTRLVGGEPADAILECAKRDKANLIALGSRGLGDLKGFFLGSVSHKVSARAECACLTIK